MAKGVFSENPRSVLESLFALQAPFRPGKAWEQELKRQACDRIFGR